jgi:4a-hydroxytetrahydrobiopterin dehydratase
MSELETKRCLACEAGIPPLSREKIQSLLKQIPEWELSADNKFIYRRYSFKGFYKTMAFVNAVAWIANQENHHPDITLGYNYCVINYTTHAIEGLSENDFICAAKVNALIS